MNDAKPAHVRPTAGSIEKTEFATPSQEAAARAILEHWAETHNFREIARRTSWSPSHIRKVFHEYFEPSEEPSSEPSKPSADLNVNEYKPTSQRRQEIREAFIEGYLTRVREELRDDPPSETPD